MAVNRQGGQSTSGKGTPLLFLPVWLPRTAWSVWLCHLYAVQPSSPWSRRLKSFLGSGNIISAGFDQRTDRRSSEAAFVAQARKQLAWFELPGGGGGVEHAWACTPLCVWVWVWRLWGCVHVDGWLDVYLQVLPQKIEVDIQKTKRQLRISQTSWRTAQRRGRFTQPQPKQNEAEKEVASEKEEFQGHTEEPQMLQNKNKMCDSYCT